jgi:hypothetical protein
MESFENIDPIALRQLFRVVDDSAYFVIAGYFNEVADGHRKHMPSLRVLVDATMDFLNFAHINSDGMEVNFPHPAVIAFERKIVEALVISFFLDYVSEG